MENTPTPQTEEQQRQILLSQHQHAREVESIVELGRLELGTATFDEASAAVAAGLGNRTQEFMAVARQFDHPHRIIEHLANNPRRLEQISKMPVARQIVEMGRIEGQMSSYGQAETGADPVWKMPASRTGRVSDEDWRQNGGAHLSDAQWHREYDRRMKEKGGGRR